MVSETTYRAKRGLIAQQSGDGAKTQYMPAGGVIGRQRSQALGSVTLSSECDAGPPVNPDWHSRRFPLAEALEAADLDFIHRMIRLRLHGEEAACSG